MLKLRVVQNNLFEVSTMARKGYKTLTIREEVYDMLAQEWSKKKKEFIKKGITSLSGFIAYLVEKEETKDNQK